MCLLDCAQLLAQQLAGALQACADCSLRDAEDAADFAGVELVISGKNERETKLFRKRLNHGVDDGMAVGGEQHLLRTGLRRGWVREIVCGCGMRIGLSCGTGTTGARTAINGDAPCHTGEKGSLVLDCLPSAIAIEFQERLLDHIFSVCCVEQDCVCDAKDEA